MEHAPKYPALTAAALMMDCSGGPVFRKMADLEASYAVASEHNSAADYAKADKELRQFSWEQLEWIALGGRHSGDDWEGAGDCPEPASYAFAECVLEHLYNA